MSLTTEDLQSIKALLKSALNEQNDYLEQRLSKQHFYFEKRFESIEKGFIYFERKFKSIDDRVRSIDDKFKSIEERFNAIDKKFEQLKIYIDQKLKDMAKELRGEIGDFITDTIISHFDKQDARLDQLEYRAANLK